MPLLILGKDPTNFLKIDPTMSAARVTTRPAETNRNYQHLGVKTGNLTGVAANAPVFCLQNLNSNLIVIKRVKICFTLTTAFGAAQYLDFGLTLGRNISAVMTGGTVVSLTGDNLKLFSDSYNVTQVNCRIATTGTLTAGTRTTDVSLPGNYISQAGNWMGAIGAMIPLITLYEALPGKYPIVLALNEGIEIAPVTTMGATGVGVLGVVIEFAETPAY